MQILTVAVMLGILGGLQSVSAQETMPQGQMPKAAPAKTYSAAESTALSEASRKKAEALEKARDRKMKSIARGICSGC